MKVWLWFWYENFWFDSHRCTTLRRAASNSNQCNLCVCQIYKDILCYGVLCRKFLNSGFLRRRFVSETLKTFCAETFCGRIVCIGDILFQRHFPLHLRSKTLCGDVLYQRPFTPHFVRRRFVRRHSVSEMFRIRDIFFFHILYCAKTLRIRSFLIYILHTDVFYRDILNRDMRYHRHSFSETFCISDVLYQRPSVS